MDWGDNLMTAISGKTQIVGIIGDPITHSLSPLMQNAAFASAGLDYVYIPFAVNPDNLGTAVSGLKALGVCGFNVTIPHKTTIIPFLDKLDETAEAAGAVNTVHLSGDLLVGYNTDGDGLVDSLAVDLEFVPGETQILIIGAGGAARGAVAALCRSGAKKLLICNRTLDNALAIKDDMNSHYRETCIEVFAQNQIDKQKLISTSLLINTTSLGMKGESIDGVNLTQMPNHVKVYDMVYSFSETPLLKDAAVLGLQAANGLGMLVGQGERAFNIWTGRKPPQGVMRMALHKV